ncbi:hypothetical protein V5N11_017502 [Cardamine amara subsp. amara]|uniref:Uncharacterized protein n=1 Tax=Cardamine amara subsp. amara TaxID=228776 RepID=A0ABD1ADM5_CARAN
MVFSSSAVVTVADVSVNTWQRMSRVPSSEMLNPQELLEVACCFPLTQLIIFLVEFLCFPLSDSDSDSDDDDDDDDDDDVLDFYHNIYGDDDHDGSSSSSNLDCSYNDHYSDSD